MKTILATSLVTLLLLAVSGCSRAVEEVSLAMNRPAFDRVGRYLILECTEAAHDQLRSLGRFNVNTSREQQMLNAVQLAVAKDEARQGIVFGGNLRPARLEEYRAIFQEHGNSVASSIYEIGTQGFPEAMNSVPERCGALLGTYRSDIIELVS